MGHAAHAATLHARADESIYETRAFRVRSLKGESVISTTQTDPFLRVRFLFLRGGDERDGSPVGRAAYAAARRDLSIHCRDGFDGLRATNIEIARVERGYFLSSSSFSAAFWRE